MSERIIQANPEHEATYQELSALIGRHADKMSAEDVLAIAANMVGKLIAMQDQRTMTPKRAMDIVARNIEFGNQQVQAMLGQTKGRA